MEIPKKLIAKWKALYSPGDYKKLSEENIGYSDETYRRALRDGKCADQVFEAMAQFYEKKSELIKEYL